MSQTAIRPLDSVTLTPGAAGVVSIPTTILDAAGLDEAHSAAVYVNIYVSGAGGCFIQADGSSETSDGRYIASGGSATYGPVKYAYLPQIYAQAATTLTVSFDILASEG